MSALDQAFIKAYAKDPATGNTLPQARSHSAAAHPAAGANPSKAAAAVPVEQWYADGAWYRVEQPAAGDVAVVVPPPHAVFPKRAGNAAREPSRATHVSAEAAPQIIVEEDPPPAERAATGQTETPAFIDPQVLNTSSEFVLPPRLEVVVVATYNGAPDASGKIECAIEPRKILRVDPPSAAVPQPHLAVAAAAVKETFATTEALAKNEQAADRKHSASHESIEKSPPSAVQAAAPSAASERPQGPAADKQNTFRPVWEVERFQWPQACEDLLSVHREYFEHAGQQLLAAARGGRKLLGIVSAHRGEGRTTLALCLARWAASAGVRVALVDSDFANPQLAVQLGLQLPCDWQHVVADKLSLAEAAIASVEDRLTLFPLKPKAAHEHVDDTDVDTSATLEKLAAAHDLVLLDMEPVAVADEGSSDGAAANQATPRFSAAALVVRNASATAPEQLTAVVNFLNGRGIEVLGVVENCVPRESLKATS